MQVEQSYFECGDCGARNPSTVVPYDRLGYAVCPVCGAQTGP